jgi:NAD(P)-dependent dehydrogenase (short-subunit alcohol dehydrogenase family)
VSCRRATRGRRFKDSGFKVYSCSKLMLLMATAELHRLLEPEGVECFAAHPGEGGLPLLLMCQCCSCRFLRVRLGACPNGSRSS